MGDEDSESLDPTASANGATLHQTENALIGSVKIKLKRTWTPPTSVPLDDVFASAFQGIKPLRHSAKASEWKDFYDLRLTLRAARTDQVISNLQLHEAIQIPTSRKTFARLISEIETARLLEVATSWHLLNLRGEPFTIPQTLGQIRRTS
ncbi:hypothetical protein [Pseudomonas sp. URMO17WK12:I11]|uniref:hypothetical protein n=1 Tax=Pseudomonas sp. URMO17WK12:I11 TaxID=1283291 RepID=UPI00211506F8|nr:hypothetical protein [Pseudomonas sp. URMO17WK12:I11]